MEFILIFRKLHEMGISAEKIDSFAQAYKEWIELGARPLIYEYGLVYYADGMLCSMPFEVRNLKPVGVEINGVFYLGKCSEIRFNPDFPDWDAQFLFAERPPVTGNDLPTALTELQQELLSASDFALELPTQKEICALTEVIGSELNCQFKNFFFNRRHYWLRNPQSNKLAPVFVMSPYQPAANPAPLCQRVVPSSRDYTAEFLPVVHQGKHTFIGHLNEFEVPDRPTLEMYKRLTAGIA